MVFTSYIFVFYFLPAVLIVYYLSVVCLGMRGTSGGGPVAKPHSLDWRNLFLVAASYAFYGWWNPWFVLLMLFSTVVDYVCGRIIAASPAGSRKRLMPLLVSIVMNLGLLGFFKYFMFAERNINEVLGWLGAEPFTILKITLPVGISFYTFQSMSYTIDVYRGKSRPVRSFIDFAAFVSLFPQLIAGPIIRYNTIAGQLVHRRHTLDRFASGVSLFMLGFAKKILLANVIGQVADAAFEAEARYALDAWYGAAAYAFQIYFDFCGYSDMAIGLGRMLGFEFPKNFNAPFLADSITDHWRRWHISLSTFLRDYLYFPLGGNRKGRLRTYFNLATVMILGGLWHGANWTFVAWGAYHGALLIFERFIGKRPLYAALPRLARIGLTFILLLLAFVIFRSPSMPAAADYFLSMFGISNTYDGAILLAGQIYTRGHLTILAVCTLVTFQPFQAFEFAEKVTWPRMFVLIALFCVALGTMFVQAFNPFLYFQF